MKYLTKSHKSILYGVDIMMQLRKNLEHYDRIKEKTNKKLRKEQLKKKAQIRMKRTPTRRNARKQDALTMDA